MTSECVSDWMTHSEGLIFCVRKVMWPGKFPLFMSAHRAWGGNPVQKKVDIVMPIISHWSFNESLTVLNFLHNIPLWWEIVIWLGLTSNKSQTDWCVMSTDCQQSMLQSVQEVGDICNRGQNSTRCKCIVFLLYSYISIILQLNSPPTETMSLFVEEFEFLFQVTRLWLNSKLK